MGISPIPSTMVAPTSYKGYLGRDAREVPRPRAIVRDGI